MYKTKKLAILLSMMSAFYLAGCSDDNSGSSDNNSGSHENKCADQNCPAGCNSETGECIEDGTSEITINGDTSSWVKIAKLPANAEGSDPWPDGIIAFDIGGTHYFGIAGEASDSIIIVDDKGNEVSNTRITESMVPSDYPCLKDDIGMWHYGSRLGAFGCLDWRTRSPRTARRRQEPLRRQRYAESR